FTFHPNRIDNRRCLNTVRAHLGFLQTRVGRVHNYTLSFHYLQFGVTQSDPRPVDKMPRTRTSASESSKVEAEKNTEPEMSTEVEEKVDLDEDNDPEETVEEEEVEYEEVEEEVEEETDEEEEVEEEVEEEDSEDEDVDTGKKGGSEGRAVDMEMKEVSGDEKTQHADLLALPPHGSEVFIGGIPNDATEEELRTFCESVGDVTEVRVMKGKNATENKGYAFVMFKTKELASKAMETLDNTEMKGRRIKCSSSQAKHKLFIGNLPKTWKEADLRKVVTEVGPGVTTIEFLKDPQNPSRNRGFSFVEYYNHACAEYSRQKMSSPNFKLANNSPIVSWADSKNAESSSTSQVKALYVKNLPKNITQEKLQEAFGRHGKISKVVLPSAKPGHENSRFGFVHYVDKSSAMKALKHSERHEIDGRLLECSLAKPQTEQKASVSHSSENRGLIPSYLPQMGYGMGGGAFSALGGGYASPALPQPFLYAAGGAPPAMMPMLLPDGRIGYVLQQPGMQPHIPMQPRGGRDSFSSGGSSNSRGGSGSSNGGKRGGANNRGRSRYNPY
ncbi:hypothetical protein V2J09_000371, partial [Rumex salicifolius]